jgi:Fe2+ transport system protein FeoA
MSSTPCPLCGAPPSDQANACSTCPVVWRCELVCCSRCGYKYPPPSRLVAWVQRLLGPAAAAPATGTLDEMPVSTRCTVESIEGDGSLRLKLAHLGVSEGALVTVEQRRPGLVLRIGHTTLALEPAVARRVGVRAVAAA